MQERTHRLIYAAETILIGAPSMTFCLPLLLVGVFMVGLALFTGSYDLAAADSSVLSIFGMLAAGVSGVVAWFALSGNFLFGGRHALLSAGRRWWFALAIGLLGSLFLTAELVRSGDWSKPMQWFFGPAMALPAAHLFWLKYTNRHMHPRSDDHDVPHASDSWRTTDDLLSPGPRSPVPGTPSPESRVPSPGL